MALSGQCAGSEGAPEYEEMRAVGKLRRATTGRLRDTTYDKRFRRSEFAISENRNPVGSGRRLTFRDGARALFSSRPHRRTVGMTSMTKPRLDQAVQLHQALAGQTLLTCLPLSTPVATATTMCLQTAHRSSVREKARSCPRVAGFPKRVQDSSRAVHELFTSCSRRVARGDG